MTSRSLANGAASRHQMWNSVGIVRSYDDEQDNAIDVEFHDTAVHHAMHLSNSLGHTVADVSQEAVLLACPATDELARWEKKHFFFSVFTSGEIFPIAFFLS